MKFPTNPTVLHGKKIPSKKIPSLVQRTKVRTRLAHKASAQSCAQSKTRSCTKHRAPERTSLAHKPRTKQNAQAHAQSAQRCAQGFFFHAIQYVFFPPPRGFRQLREACRKNFHLVVPSKTSVVTSYDQKTKKLTSKRVTSTSM